MISGAKSRTLVCEEPKAERQVHPDRQILARVFHVIVDQSGHIEEDEAQAKERDLRVSRRSRRSACQVEPVYDGFMAPWH